MSRAFFRKGIAAARLPHPKKAPKEPRTPNIGRVCVAAMTRADGVVVKKLMSATKAQLVMGAQRGGQKVQEGQGSPSRFTSESGHKAAMKLWYGRHARRRFNKAINRRIGGPSKNRAPLDKAALRTKHTGCVTRGVYYNAPVWYLQRVDRCGSVIAINAITERTALRRLGYLNYARLNFVPESIQLVPLPGHRQPGMRPARSATQKP